AGYDIASLVESLEGVAGDPARESTMVGLWKYLLVTEIVAAVCRDYERRLEQRLPVSEEEGTLWERADKYGWMDATFAERFQHVVESDTSVSTRIESVYREQIAPIIPLLTIALRDKKRVCVLIDNVDKAWSREADFGVLSRFLLSL